MRTRTIAAVLAGAALAAAGAGAGVARAATPALTPADQALFAYAKCMRGKGVAIPDPVKGSNGTYAFPAIPKSVTGAAGVRAKAQACATASGANRQGAGGGRFGGFRGPQTPAQKAAQAKFQACLKQNGVTFPTRPAGTRPPGTRPPGTRTTPRPGGGAPGVGRFSGNPKFQAAFAKCRALLPANPATG